MQTAYTEIHTVTPQEKEMSAETEMETETEKWREIDKSHIGRDCAHIHAHVRFCVFAHAQDARQ